MEKITRPTIHHARQWWGFVYNKQWDLYHKYFDAEHCIDNPKPRISDIRYIWQCEGKPIVQLQKLN